MSKKWKSWKENLTTVDVYKRQGYHEADGISDDDASLQRIPGLMRFRKESLLWKSFCWEPPALGKAPRRRQSASIFPFHKFPRVILSVPRWRTALRWAKRPKPVSYTHLDVYKRQEYNRCKICGRPHAYLRKFGICRICFRELAYKGEIPGVKKASW